VETVGVRIYAPWTQTPRSVQTKEQASSQGEEPRKQEYEAAGCRNLARVVPRKRQQKDGVSLLNSVKVA